MSENNFIVYETTNLINGKYYIGMTSGGDNLKYMGSGQYFKKALSKYKRYNFFRVTLFSFNNKIDMINKEKEIVTSSLIQNPNCYNLALGGSGGCPHTPTTKKKMSKAKSGKNNPNFGKSPSKETKDKLSEANTGKVFTSTHKKNISTSAKNRKPVRLICPHCGKEGTNNIFYRWHFNNCKVKASVPPRTSS